MQLAQAASRRAPRRPLLAALVAASLAVTPLTSAPASATILPPELPPVALPQSTDGTAAACTGQPPFKATIVVGPVGSATSSFRAWADEIATAASAAGMNVCRVYTPYADKKTVRRAARGADLFVALMHGNGYPSFARGSGDGNDATAHGLGLNASPGSSANKYYGADWVRDKLTLAPGAIVLLSHMCYTSGNGEDTSTTGKDNRIPSLEWAVRHVDNFAQGFLASGSHPAGGHPSAVISLQSQRFPTSDPKGNLIASLMRGDTTLDELFMTTYTRNSGASSRDAYLPNHGAIGTHDFYVTRRPDGSRLRSPGTIHIDPDLAYPGKAVPTGWDPRDPDVDWLDWFAGRKKGIPNPNGSGVVSMGYARSIAGSLRTTTAEWRAGASGGSPAPATGSPKPAPKAKATKVAIPRVRGLTPAKARAAIEKAGLRVKASVRKVAHASVAKGRVVNTYPSHQAAGKPRKLARGAVVQLKVSTGR